MVNVVTVDNVVVVVVVNFSLVVALGAEEVIATAVMVVSSTAELTSEKEIVVSATVEFILAAVVIWSVMVLSAVVMGDEGVSEAKDDWSVVNCVERLLVPETEKSSIVRYVAETVDIHLLWRIERN